MAILGSAAYAAKRIQEGWFDVKRIDHVGDFGQWTFHSHRPARVLAPYVTEMQGYREHGCGPISRVEIPGCVIPIIIILDRGFAVGNGDTARPLKRTFAAGFTCSPTPIGSDGDAYCMQIDLTPSGAMRLLGPALGAMTDQIVDLAELDGILPDGLEGRLAELNSWEARFALLEGWLEERLLTDRHNDARMDFALTALTRQGDAARIARLADRMDMSRKHLHALFKSRIGLSPKAYAQVARFARAASAVRSNTASLVEVALDSGYADQAHFNREFRAFSGMTPTRYRRQILSDGTGLVVA